MAPFSSGGMSGTHAWGGLYQGDAIVWLEAQIAIHQQSDDRLLLCDTMRAVNRASGGDSAGWSPGEMMVVGDGATGTTVDANLYETFASRGFDVRLADLFERLRVATPPSGSVRFDQGNEACHGYPINCCSIAMPLTEQGAYMTTGDLACGWQGSGLSIEYLAAR
jgi:hypothetical protein